MPSFIQVTVAINSKEIADKIAENLVMKRLAASVWVSGPVTSSYWWKGKVERAEEWVCTAKTREELYNSVEQAIKAIHPYEEPGILALPVVAGSQSYLNWITRETRAPSVIIGKHLERDNSEQNQESSKEDLLKALGNAYERLIEAAKSAEKRGILKKGGEWGPREIVAHIAGWEANAIVRVPKIISGEPHFKYDDDAFNAAIITAVGNQSLEEVCSILRQTYKHDIEMLREQGEEMFVLGNFAYERTRAAINHAYEHAQALDSMN